MPTHVMSVSTGYRMDERPVTQEKPANRHGFVSATEWLRTQPLHAKLPLCSLDCATVGSQVGRNIAALVSLFPHGKPRINALRAALAS